MLAHLHMSELDVDSRRIASSEVGGRLEPDEGGILRVNHVVTAY